LQLQFLQTPEEGQLLMLLGLFQAQQVSRFVHLQKIYF